ncbi:hypothetical protein VNI00_018471 [Paramarasmius palmivorus]|uniref:Uncharacterized protein n=1 Tax=Paramarasmius palmivorus TaxID=297713 RepID=A0AAW0AWK6_9AGAR
MSDTPENIGTTLAGGIQDVSALLPLLGTEQVERHVGSALEKGYLYAAASNLSLFGSLGSAKAAFATCVGTITHRRFYGGQWLDDAGFGTAGSVTSMVTIDKDTGQYGAEVKLKKLLEEQHIDDPNLVSGFEWSGWGRVKPEGETSWYDGYNSYRGYWKEIKDDMGELDFMELVRDIRAVGRKALYPWNVQLIITSAFCTILSITPYIYLASHQWNNPLSWVYPVLRSFGSFLCAVCIQLALQLRIHHITNTSLEWMKAKHKKDNPLEETYTQKVQPLEQHIRAYLHEHEPPSSTEQGIENVPNVELKALLAVSPMLVIYQLLIAAGMVMIVVGYVGCFSIVKNSNAPAGPYVWFGMEAFLSLLRMVLWGLNPSWDESTGLTMKLKLHTTDDDDGPYYPLITSPYDSAELGFVEKLSSPKPFTVFSEAEFFAAATSWIGPIQRLGANAITLYYALLPIASTEPQEGSARATSKDLSITILFTDSRSLTFLWCGNANPSNNVFSSELKMVSGSSSYYQVLLGDQIKQENDGFLHSQLFLEVQEHAQELRRRLFQSEEKQNNLLLVWNLSSTPRNQKPPASTGLIFASPKLSDHDNKYLNLVQLWNSVAQYLESQQCVHRNTIVEATNETLGLHGANPIVLETEIINIIECAILEVYLWERESTFVDHRSKDDKLALQLHPECLQAMNTRIIAQKDKAFLRYEEHGWKEANDSKAKLIAELMKVWDHLHSTLQSLRSYIHINDLGQRIQTIRAFTAQIGTESAGAPMTTILNHFMELVPRTISAVFDTEANWGGDESREERLSHLWLLLGVMTVEPLMPYNRWLPYISLVQKNTICSLALTYTSNIQNICALEVQGDVLQRQYLKQILQTQQNSSQQKQLTTLILQSFNSNSSDLKSALTDHITKHPNILCLMGTRCHRPGEACEESHCKAILTNQELWKMSVEKGSGFTYQVGFEAFWSGDVQARGDYIQLENTGRALVLFYAPSAGEVTIMLSMHNTHDEPIELKATLKSDLDGILVPKTQEVSAGKEESKDEQENVVFVFSVQKGVGEITIQSRWRRHKWEIHGLVKVGWKSRDEVEQRVEGGLEDRGGE